jgi:hypothetical protein
MKKLLLGAVCLLIVAGLGHSHEFPGEKSLRIRALGEHFAGVVSDDETDVLINPARLSDLTSNTIFSRIGSSPSYIYYSGKIPYQKCEWKRSMKTKTGRSAAATPLFSIANFSVR